jgi:predicted nucleotidyltransferase
MTPIPRDFKEFLKLLNEKKVEYLVIGGYAVAFHGYPRPTGDLDVWIAVHPNNIDGVVEVLREFGFAGNDTSPSLFAEPGVIIRMGVPPIRIELQTRISGVAFEECYQHRIVGDFDGQPVNLIDLDHLKKNKRAAGRNKDLNDLENLP